jgi:Na+-transporting NADH:ubiquinone oxidoreductase subunit F
MVSNLIAIGITTGIFSILSLLLILAERYLAKYPVCIITINEGSTIFEVPGGGTLLSSLYDNKVFIPSACGGKGSCGYCKVRVLDGGGPVLPTETPYLNRSEQRSGIRLACQVKIKQNMSISLPEELLSVKEYKAIVSSSIQVTHDIKEINLDLIEPKEINQRPGQYIQIQAIGPDGPVFRAYSISSASYEKNKVQLVVRLIPGGIASTYIHNLKESDEVIFTGPYGEFKLSEDEKVDVVCVGGGAGMAPMANIIYSIYDRWPNRKCYLFFGCRTTQDIFYLESFEELAKKHPNFEVCYGLSDPLDEDEKWHGDTGFIHLSVDKRLEVNPRQTAFLCGPPPMIEAVTEVLKQKGIKDENIFYDKF